jgi:alpha-tubulin suppressor-like RCC1 family protein
MEPLAGAVQLAAGVEFSCAVTTAGGVKCWGRNGEGQLGDGSREPRRNPADVSGLSSGVSAITAGDFHVCALTTGGGVKCWGKNEEGQLGDGSSTTRLTAVDVSGLGSGVMAIAAGDNHTCALSTSGAVKCWGSNAEGQLGDGSTTNRFTAFDVSGLSSGVRSLAAASGHSCALSTGGGVKCWGANGQGQLGDGSTTRRLTPVAVSGMSGGINTIATGGDHSCALTEGGGVKCWGSNGQGQLGDGTTTSRLTAVDVSGLGSGVSALAAGSYDHTCALTAGGGVKCWGNNLSGQLGDGTNASRRTAVDVSGLSSGISAIAAGKSHTCALTVGGTITCWGSNGQGQLGDHGMRLRPTPFDVSGLGSGISSIAGGGNHSCALTDGGGVKCWGFNSHGQLGDGSTADSRSPVDVSGLSSGVSSITAGDSHTCAVTSGGGVKCWGRNGEGQLGDDQASVRPIPGDVIGLTSGVSSIAAGSNHTCALTAGGGVKCWGINERGQLGDGSTTIRRIAVDVSGLSSGVSTIAAGGSQTCAVSTGGGAKCWGANLTGQLGDGGTTDSHTPVDVSGLSSGISDISTGIFHTCALTLEGGVKCWGPGSGLLGDGSGAEHLTAVDVSGLSSGVIAISVGGLHTCALTTDGGVKCWGGNAAAQLGDGSSISRVTAVDVSGLGAGINAIDAGGSHTCGLTTGGGVKCWGSNVHEQIGDGGRNDGIPAPVVIDKAQSQVTSPSQGANAGSGSPVSDATGR